MNNKIQVFQSEQDAGLESLIRSTASIAYDAPALLSEKIDTVDVFRLNEDTEEVFAMPFTKAAMDDDDVYSVYSVLVSTAWNKNDDVFDKNEVWIARSTPKYKPTNIEHDERQIVGGIIDSWAVDKNFKLIDENVNPENLPDHYHIVVSSVIYKQWQDPAYRKRATDLIEDIEAGEKYVSMECIFHGFDYAVVDPEGRHHVIQRNDESAFLTSYLRAYGGEGSYQEHQIGRLIRSITFSGKGFVEKPANPESVIFDKNKSFNFHKSSVSAKTVFSDEIGVNKKIEESNTNIFIDPEESLDMSNEILNDQVRELKEALEAAQVENKELADRLSVANVAKYESTIEELNETLKSKEEAVANMRGELEEALAKLEEAAADIQSKSEALEKAEAFVSEMRAAESLRARKASLIEAGLSEEDADEKLEAFAGLTDDQFQVLADTLSEYASQTEPEEGAVESAGHDETESVRAGLQDWVNKVILNKESGE